jgi:hypothetical protein
MMPFWQFFGATLLGKAFVKVNMQVGGWAHAAECLGAG